MLRGWSETPPPPTWAAGLCQPSQYQSALNLIFPRLSGFTCTCTLLQSCSLCTCAPSHAHAHAHAHAHFRSATPPNQITPNLDFSSTNRHLGPCQRNPRIDHDSRLWTASDVISPPPPRAVPRVTASYATVTASSPSPLCSPVRRSPTGVHPGASRCDCVLRLRAAAAAAAGSRSFPHAWVFESSQAFFVCRTRHLRPRTSVTQRRVEIDNALSIMTARVV